MFYPQISVPEIHSYAIRLIRVSPPTWNNIPKLAGKGKHALIWAGGTLLLTAFNNPFPYCIEMLPIKFSWKLLPSSMSIWLFPHAQAEDNHLSLTRPFGLLFSAFPTCSGSPCTALTAPEALSCCLQTSMSTRPL